MLETNSDSNSHRLLLVIQCYAWLHIERITFKFKFKFVFYRLLSLTKCYAGVHMNRFIVMQSRTLTSMSSCKITTTRLGFHDLVIQYILSRFGNVLVHTDKMLWWLRGLLDFHDRCCTRWIYDEIVNVDWKFMHRIVYNSMRSCAYYTIMIKRTKLVCCDSVYHNNIYIYHDIIKRPRCHY